MASKPMTKRHRPGQAELDAMGIFLTAMQSGRNPGVERFLKRYPEFAGTLRPVLEGMTILSQEYRRFQRRYPNIDIEQLYCVPRVT